MELMKYEALMKRLREKRKELDLQQKKVAHEAGIDASFLNKIERHPHSNKASYDTVYDVWKVIDSADREDRETAKDVMNSPIVWAQTEETHEEIRRRMVENDYSQLPVREAGGHVGRITEGILMGNEDQDRTIGELMGDPLIEIPQNTGRDAVQELLADDNPAVLVTEEDECIGIITKADLL